MTSKSPISAPLLAESLLVDGNTLDVVLLETLAATLRYIGLAPAENQEGRSPALVRWTIQTTRKTNG